MNQYRLFLAVDLPPMTQKAVMQRIKQARLKHVTLQPQDHLHITIKFYGLVDEEMIPQLIRSIEETLIGTDPFSIIMSDPGAFPTEKKPHTLWFGISGDVIRLTKVAQIFQADDDQAFIPHLTIGKVDQKVPLKDKQVAFQKFKAITFSKPVWFEASELTLFRSKLTASKPIYSKIATFSLR